MPKRYITKKRSLVAATVIVLVCLFGLPLLYRFNDDFKESVQEVYHAVYSRLFIEPTMKSVADERRDIAYCNTNSALQKMDVYTPKNSDTPRPVAVYIHGGGWTSGDKSNPFVIDYGAEIVRNNMAFISINYRLAPKAVYPAQNQDVDCALAYITAHASELHVDASKLAVIGDSAGAQLAAMAALTSPSKSVIRAVVDFYGPSDIWAQITRKPRADQWAINYIGNAQDETRARQASPLDAQLTGAPPFLILHGLNDKTVHYEQSQNFAVKLKAADVEVTLVPVQNANHYFSTRSVPTINTIETQVVTFLQRYLQ